MNARPLPREDAFVRRRVPVEFTALECGERIGGGRVIAERLQERDEELLRRVRPAVAEHAPALVAGERRDHVQRRGPGAGREPSGLGQGRNAIDVRPIERFEERERLTAGADGVGVPETIAEAPRRAEVRVRLDE